VRVDGGACPDLLDRGADVGGVTFGRPAKLRPEQRELVARLLQEGRAVSEVARTFNVHPATIYRCSEMLGLRPRPKAL
jgi:DNA invertase Pin-like site-specific DNA recombinase